LPLRRNWTTFWSFTHLLKLVEFVELGWLAVDLSSTLTSTAESDVDGAIGCPSQDGGGDPSSVPHKGPNNSWI
jgi:hypothetical protein